MTDIEKGKEVVEICGQANSTEWGTNTRFPDVLFALDQQEG